jgi:hypothetical protein
MTGVVEESKDLQSKTGSQKKKGRPQVTAFCMLDAPPSTRWAA